MFCKHICLPQPCQNKGHWTLGVFTIKNNDDRYNDNENNNNIIIIIIIIIVLDPSHDNFVLAVSKELQIWLNFWGSAGISHQSAALSFDSTSRQPSPVRNVPGSGFRRLRFGNWSPLVPGSHSNAYPEAFIHGATSASFSCIGASYADRWRSSYGIPPYQKQFEPREHTLITFYQSWGRVSQRSTLHCDFSPFLNSNPCIKSCMFDDTKGPRRWEFAWQCTIVKFRSVTDVQ